MAIQLNDTHPAVAGPEIVRLLVVERRVSRLSGAGTEGATLRFYLERFEPDPTRQAEDPQAALAKVIEAAQSIADIKERLNRDVPDVRT